MLHFQTSGGHPGSAQALIQVLAYAGAAGEMDELTTGQLSEADRSAVSQGVFTVADQEEAVAA